MGSRAQIRQAVLVGVLIVSGVAITRASWAGEVRPLQPRGARVIGEGTRRSPTLRALVDEIRRSDLVVYVDLDPNDASPLDGSLQFKTATADARYVRIWLQPRRTDEALMALLGHEFHHAVEVARMPDMRSLEGFTAFYATTGMSSTPGHYDTAAAQAAGVAVREELETRR